MLARRALRAPAVSAGALQLSARPAARRALCAPLGAANKVSVGAVQLPARRRNRSSAALSGPGGKVRASADKGRSDDLSSGFASGFLLGAGSERTCTRTRIPVNSHPARFNAASRSALRCRTIAATAPASATSSSCPFRSSATRRRSASGRGRWRRTISASASSRSRREAQAASVASERRTCCNSCGERTMAARAAGPRCRRGPRRMGKVWEEPD